MKLMRNKFLILNFTLTYELYLFDILLGILRVSKQIVFLKYGKLTKAICL